MCSFNKPNFSFIVASGCRVAPPHLSVHQITPPPPSPLSAPTVEFGPVYDGSISMELASLLLTVCTSGQTV